MCGAITHAHPAYEAIGVKDAAGNYRQLSTNLLQIENEFYSSIRPKRTTQSGETALQALRLRGVEYIEVRCVDLNPYEPLGITAEQMHFFDAFLLHCLFNDSPHTSDEEYAEGQENQKRIVYFGRDPQLKLIRAGREIGFQQWATEILDGSMEAATLLDQANDEKAFTESVKQQYRKLTNPALTPSAQVLTDLQNQSKSFFEHTQALAEQHRTYFEENPLEAGKTAQFHQQAKKSLAEQHQLETEPQINFDEYLANYYAQYRGCSCE